MRLIFKFGGSSLSSVSKIKNVAKFISETKKRKNLELVVVVSAMGNTTNKLEQLATSISSSKINSAYSSLLSLGENISTYLLTLALDKIGVDAVGLTSKDIKIYAQGSPSCSLITYIDKSSIEKYLSENKVVVISGFQGENSLNQTHTLGRGGSDTTAVALGSVLNANVKIFTDVKGFYSLNPKSYNNPNFLKSINIHSAVNLSTINAKVLDYRCLCLANQNKTNLEVCESLKNSGTKIIYDPIENYQIDGISVKNKILFVKNQSKKSNFLQTIIQKCNLRTYFYQKDSYEVLALEASDSLLKMLAEINNEKLLLKNADVLVLTGSGLLIHKEFIKKVQKCINDLKISIKYINLTQTILTIVTNPNQATFLEKALAYCFKLIKEQ